MTMKLILIFHNRPYELEEEPCVSTNKKDDSKVGQNPH